MQCYPCFGAYVLANLAEVYHALGDYNGSLGCCRSDLVIAREIGDRRGEGNCLSSIGNAYQALGRFRKASGYHEQSHAIASEMGSRHEHSITSWNLGLSLVKLRELERAVESMQVSVEYHREIGPPDAEEDAAYIDELRAQIAKQKKAGK